MKKLSIILALVIFLALSIPVNAKDYSKSLKTVNFSSLSDEDIQTKLENIAKNVSKDLGLPYTPKISTYDCDWYKSLASNTLIPIGGQPTICVNLSGLTEEEAEAKGMTVDYLIVHIIAHECRHSFQYEHQNDDSEYGKACKDGYNAYTQYYDDLSAYKAQFLEVDANEYAKMYADKYCK